MGQEVYKLEAQLLSTRIVSSYVQDWERALEILAEIKKQGHSQFFHYQIVEEITLYQLSGAHDWVELERWRRPQPLLTTYDNTSPNPLAIVERTAAWLFNNSGENPYQRFSLRQPR